MHRQDMRHIKKILTASTPQASTTLGRYVSAVKLLEILFDDDSRPSLRWIRDQQKNRTLPFSRIGRRVFFDPELVRTVMNAKAIGVRHNVVKVLS
jgi:hypothetical protein